MSELTQLLQEANGRKPVATINGRDLYTVEDAQKRNEAELIEAKAGHPVQNLGDRQMNANGTYSHGLYKNVVIPEGFFSNRYRKVGKKYEVVTDYRAIQEQATGKVYTDNIVVHVIIAGKNGGVELETTRIVSSSEFVREFKKKLDTESMKKIYEVISTVTEQDTTSDKLEF